MPSNRSKKLAKMIREGRIRLASASNLKSRNDSASTCDVPADDAERRALADSFIARVRAKALAAGMTPEEFDAELGRLKAGVVAKVQSESTRPER